MAAVHPAVTRAAANAQGKIDKAIEKVKKLEEKSAKYAEETKHQDDSQIQQMKGTIADLKGQLDTIGEKYAEAKTVELTAAFITDLKNSTAPLRDKLTATVSELHTQVAEGGLALVKQNTNVTLPDATKIHDEMKDALKRVERAVKGISELEDIADLYTGLIKKDEDNMAAKEKDIAALKDAIEQDEKDKAAKDTAIEGFKDIITKDEEDKAAKDAAIEGLKDIIKKDEEDKAEKDKEIEALKDLVQGLKDTINVKDGKIEALMKIINTAHADAHEVVD